MNNIAIKLTKVSKKYVQYSKKPGLRNVFTKKISKDFFPLKNVSLTIKKGESLGIVGPNGAGKTTLLEVIAGIKKLSSGKVEINGKVVAMMSLDAGFHPDLSGSENIYLNGMLVGMNKSEIKEKYKKIVAFSGVGKFIDSPFYTYSEGMKFRLAFSIAIESECEILIMDEIFVAGDADFQHKIIKTIQKLQKKGVTIIVCSHAPLYIWGFSNVFVEMKNGRLKTLSKQEVKKMIRENDEKWGEILDYSYQKSDRIFFSKNGFLTRK